MARKVSDLAMLLSFQAGPDLRSPLSIEQNPAVFTEPLKRDVKGMRIAWLGDFGGHLPFEAGVLDLCREALKTFEDLGCTVEEFVPDFDPELIWRNWLTLRAWLVGSKLAGFYADPAKRALLKPEARWEVEQGLNVPAFEIQRPPWRGRPGITRSRNCSRPTTPRAADRAGLPLRREARLAEGDRRPKHGHLSPLDGGRDPGHDVGLPRDQRAGRLQPGRTTHGNADRRAQPR